MTGSNEGRSEEISAQLNALRAELNEAEFAGDYDRYVECAYAMLEIGRKAGLKKTEAFALSNIGGYHPDSFEGEKLIRQALTIWTEVDYRSGMVGAMRQIGYLYRHRNELDKALDIWNEALGLVDETVSAFPYLDLLVSLYQAYMLMGDAESSMKYAEEAYGIAFRNDWADMQATILGAMAGFISDQGDNERALTYCKEAVAALEADGRYPQPRARAQVRLAEILLKLQRPEEAVPHAESAISILQSMSESHTRITRGDLLDAFKVLGEAYLLQERWEEAGIWARQAYTLSLESEEVAARCDGTAALGCYLARVGAYDEAVDYLNRALDLARTLDQPSVFFAIHATLYEAYKSMGRYAEALEHHELYMARHLEIFSHRSDQRLRQLEVRHALDKNEKELAIQRLHSQQLQQQVERQRSELAAQAMHLARQTELLGHFRNDLRAIVREATDPTHGMKAVREKLKELPCEAIDWTKFDAEFRSTYPEFQSKLLQRWPTLTGTELKVCSLLKLRLTSVDIGKLLCISERSVESHRYNIRRKLGLEREQDLGEVLAGI